MAKLLLLASALFLSGCARPGALIGGVIAGAVLLISANTNDNGENDGSPGGQNCRVVPVPGPGGGTIGMRVCD